MRMALDLISIGKRIRYYRLQNNWTMEDLSIETGISLQQIGHIERGERSCSVKSLVLIANAFRIPADELLVDNLLVTNSKRDGDEYYILLDCTPEEATILIKNMKNLKEILRKYTVK